jgi:hypothetical protein
MKRMSGSTKRQSDRALVRAVEGVEGGEPAWEPEREAPADLAAPAVPDDVHAAAV